MKSLLIVIAMIIAIGLLTSSAMAVTWDGAQSGSISVTCDIPGYAQIQWQDTQIAFSNNNDATGDYWNDTAVEGSVYNPLPKGTSDPDEIKASTDPWAGYSDGVWYESRDNAMIYLHSNADLTMTVADNGPLTSGSDTVPTWFTLSAYGSGGSALINSQPYGGSPGLPGSQTGTTGTFLYESGTSLLFGNSSYEFPQQDAIPLDGGSNSWDADLDAETDATLTFVVRIHRNGLSDVMGTYTTSIGVSFNSP